MSLLITLQKEIKTKTIYQPWDVHPKNESLYYYKPLKHNYKITEEAVHEKIELR